MVTIQCTCTPDLTVYRIYYMVDHEHFVLKIFIMENLAVFNFCG